MTRISIDLSAIPAQVTGVGRYATEMLAELVPMASFQALEMFGICKDGDSDRFVSRIPGLQTLSVVPSNRVARLGYEQFGLRVALRRNRIDLHHGIHYTLPGGRGQKSVVTIHDATMIEHPEWHERSKVLFFGAMIARAAKLADGLIFPSQDAANAFLRHFDTRAEMRVIPHGVSAERFGNVGEGSDEKVLARLGVQGRFFMFCGTLEPRKNLGRLLAAFNNVRNDGATLVIAGLAGWRGNSVAPILDDLSRSSSVKTLGYVSDSDLGVLFRNAVACLYPSLEEGFGLPGLEAMSQGCLLVTSAGTAMAEYAQGTAVFVDPLSVESITAALIRASRGGTDLDSLAINGRSVAASMTWTRSAQGHLDLYRSILGI